MKKILVSMVIILMLFSITSVRAEDSKNLNFTSNTSEIERGKEVILTITSEEVTGIQGKIEYDKNVWTLSNKSSDCSFTLDEETGKFVLANLSGEEKISAELTLKSKENTTVSSSSITISEIAASDKTGASYDITEKEITIKFKEETYEQIQEQVPENTNPTGTTNSQNTSKPTNSTISKAQKIPKTGSESISAIIAISVSFSVVLFLKYKKYNF